MRGRPHGYELARRLREELGPSVRLMAVTGYGTETDVERSRAAGFEWHFVKPLDMEKLLGVVGTSRAEPVEHSIH